MSASAKASSLYDAWSPRLLRSAICTAASTVRLRRSRSCTAPFAHSASSSVRMDTTSFLMVSPATLATTVIPPSGENVAHPERAKVESSTATRAGFLYIARAYWSDFGAGATRLFCLRQEDGAVGRRLV